MAPKVPPNEKEVFNVLFFAKNHSSDNDKQKQMLEFLEDIIRGLMSQTYLKEYYTAFATMIKMDTTLNATDILNLINDNLKAKSDITKGEKRIYATARVFALGGLVRSGKVTDTKIIGEILHEFTIHAQRRGMFSSITTPFILTLLETLASNENSNEVSLDHLQRLIDNPENPSRLQILLKAKKLGLKVDYTLLDSLDEVCDILLKFVPEDDHECLDSLFAHLGSNKNNRQEFFKNLSEKLRSKNLGILKSVVSCGIKNGCPLQFLITREIVTFLLKAFIKGASDSQKQTVASETLGLLMTWNADVIKNFKKKDRITAIQFFFEGVPNLLHEYKFLHIRLQRFLTYLSSEELDEVARLCELQLQDKVNGQRLEMAATSFLCRLATTKNTSDSTKCRILMMFFNRGYCEHQLVKEKTEENVTEDNNFGETNLVAKSARRAFIKVLGNLWNEQEVINKIFQEVYIIAIDSDTKFKGNETALVHWKQANKLHMKNPILSKFLKLNLILLLTEVNKTDDTVVELLKLSTAKEETQNSKIAKSVISSMFEDANQKIVNFTPIIQDLFKNEKILQNCLQLIVNVFDPENIPDDNDDEEEEGSSNSEDDDDDEQQTTNSKIDVKKLSALINNKSPSAADTDESESDIDMDEAPEEELEKMNQALSKVFSTKKKVKEQDATEIKLLMRACTAVEIIFRVHKPPSATIIPQLLIPCITCLIKSSKLKKKGAELYSRISKLIKAINIVKKVNELENVDNEIIDGLTEDLLNLFKNKKLVKKVRELINGSLKMLTRCYKKKEEVNVLVKKNPKKQKAKVQKQNSKANAALEAPVPPVTRQDMKRKKSLGGAEVAAEAEKRNTRANAKRRKTIN